MLYSSARTLEFGRTLGHLFGLAFLFLGIFLERPFMFAGSILVLLLSTPLTILGNRLLKFKLELAILVGLISIQAAAEGQLNALILTIYLMGLVNGLLLPDPTSIRPKLWIFLFAICAGLALFFSSELPSQLGLAQSESAFGNNPDEYQIDPRSLAYAMFILLIYLSPHFQTIPRTALHASLLFAFAAMGTNKFGMAYALLVKLAPRFVVPVIFTLFCIMAAIGFSSIEFTSARAALWSDFFKNFSTCDSVHGVCIDLIGLNNEEGVRSFHSIVLDFSWYGGLSGLLGGLYFLIRVVRVKSDVGRSAAPLFAVALLFGFPPFFNERHVLIIYALFILFQPTRCRDLLNRPLRAHRPISIPQ